MFRWERRLKDLAQLLHQCESTYFDPELFRLNTNQFLQTSRTVTFLIQKVKAEIPDYEKWYKKNIIDAWNGDTLMTWAKDSRNTIEKEGDLDMYSSLSVTLFYSYITDQDIILPCGRTELLEANVKKLKRFALRNLPSAISDAAVVKTERKWVANTLPNWELLQAFKYIYSRIYICCKDLAAHLNKHLNSGIRRPADTSLDDNNPRETIYFKLNTKDQLVVRHERIPFNPDDLQQNPLKGVNQQQPYPKNIEDLVSLYARYAKTVFEKDEYHIPMCFLFDSSAIPIDACTTRFDDQADKYIFWRTVADRVEYLKPNYIVWISEGWLRDAKYFNTTPIRNLPITGEFLEVVGLDVEGILKRATRMIIRDKKTVKLEEKYSEFQQTDGIPNFFRPAFEAMQLAHHRTPC